MAITDIDISEELMTNAPSIKYRGEEGPKSPEEEQMMMADALLQEEYEKYVYDLLEIRPEATPMSFDEFRQMVIAEGQMSKGPVLPQDPTKPVNPFQPKPTGPTLPNRQMAAYGGIMGMDGRKQYGIGSWFQKAKDKFVDDIIPNEIKENPLLTAAAVAAGDYYLNDRSYLDNILKGTKDFVLGEEIEKKVGERPQDVITERGPNVLKRILGTSTGENKTVGSDILGSISKNIVPIVGGIGAGLFTKNTESNNPGLPSDNTALNLAEYKKAANLLNQKQGLAADMNFLPTVASRKYSPEEMAVTYAQAAATGGRIGYQNAGPVLDEQTTQMILDMHGRGMDIDTIQTITQQDPNAINAIIN